MTSLICKSERPASAEMCGMPQCDRLDAERRRRKPGEAQVPSACQSLERFALGSAAQSMNGENPKVSYNWLRVSLERNRDVKKRCRVGAQEWLEGCEKIDRYAIFSDGL
jgi:hypothetical protein